MQTHTWITFPAGIGRDSGQHCEHDWKKGQIVESPIWNVQVTCLGSFICAPLVSPNDEKESCKQTRRLCIEKSASSGQHRQAHSWKCERMAALFRATRPTFPTSSTSSIPATPAVPSRCFPISHRPQISSSQRQTPAMTLFLRLQQNRPSAILNADYFYRSRLEWLFTAHHPSQ